ncbi:hypothetical protein BO71DRAFT_453625 [Aspergillus ellipticus CBS 707.79]|uniref:F-box domain-containing protein n=1 Tax=Aspergillus ellipticus CBS 707.79 TaxID=1448320 RepID=A0A319EDK7_9EURO|nr:hypothetical protein BO71DRAFT_453625 [Aspergillus ellipticus CBS 707.79]
MPALPAELILQIIECLIPSRLPTAFPPTHPVTRTLISLTLTSKLTLKLAPNLRVPETVAQLDILSSNLSCSLRRLVVQMPLRYLYPDDDHEGLLKIMRNAFLRLSAIEELCSVQDEFCLSTLWGEYKRPVWSTWPRLRCLALYNVCVDHDFVQALRQCPNLTHLVLTRSESLGDVLPLALMNTIPWPALKRVVIINTVSGHEYDVRSKWTSQELYDTSFLARLLLSSRNDRDHLLVSVTVPTPPGREDDDINLCWEWVCSHAVDRTLWEFPGTPWQLE